MNLDLSKFKKSEASDKHTTLQHENGHVLKVAHHGLSKEFRRQLEEMPVNLAKGGYAKFSQKFDPNMGAKPSKPSKADTNMPGNQAAASKAFTEPKDMGTDIPRAQLQQELNDKQFPDVVVNSLNRKAPPYGALSSEPSQHYPPCINPSCKSFGKSHPNCTCYGGNPEGKASHMFADGGEVEKEYYCDNNRTHFKNCEYFKDGGEAGDSDSDKLEKVAQEINSESSAQAPDVASAPSASPLPAPMNPNPEMSSQPNQSAAAPSAQSQEGPSQEPQYPDPFANSAPTPAPVPGFSDADSFKRYHMDDMMNQQKAYEDELNSGQIQPQHYFHLFSGDKDANGKPTVLGRIGSAFGLMLGGIGSGLTGQPNAPLQIMQNEIKNDLDAQQNSVANKQNFLKINQQGLMDRAHIDSLDQESAIKAYAQSQTQMNTTAFHSLVQDVNKIPANSPQGIAARQKLAMMWPAVQQANLGIMDKASSAAAFQNMLMGTEPAGMTPNADPEAAFQRRTNALRMLGPDGVKKAEDLQSKHIAGLPGFASEPLSDGDKGDLRKGMVFDKSMNDLVSWTKAHPNGAVPGSPEDQRGRALAGIVQGGFRGATNGGVYKSGEQDFINKLVPEDPTKAFNAYRVLPKLQSVQKEMASQLDAKAKTYGFQGYPGLQQQQEVHPQEGKLFINPKTGQRGTFKNGKWVTL